MVKYSTVKKRLKIEVERTTANGLAHLTHYFQNHVNGVSQHYIKPATEYLSQLSDELQLVEEPQMQQLLPMKFDVPFPPPTEYDFTFLDLFAGIGGFRIPLQELKGKCVFTSEFNYQAQRTYEHNFGEVPFGDITKLDLNIVPKHDILTAGFPCQPFSISGKMKGFEDTRGTLIYNVFQIIEKRQPKVVFLENVKHLIHHDKGNTLKTIVKDLEALDYKVSWKLLNASDFGVPQNRERVIIIGHKDIKFDFTKLKTKPKTNLKRILDKDVKFEYLDEPYTILDDYRIQESGLIFIGHRNKSIRIAGVRPGTEHLSRVHKQPNRIYSSEGLHPALPSQESSGRFWIYDEGKVRKLTINECYKIMGFPEKFIKNSSLSDSYRQIGNSVCVPMIKEIATQIKAQLL
ncbi:MAG: DNA (cytosine-5-)-methyltransferase [Saprospiraceae bacterium]|nr:DNA (cytosine-5-)-methyltransferase [Saprospiraceae bacterium]MCF8250338.1 DNA (cytosine-5-)-methyltransferase [Saprospiraceae bacterium]MCF8281520.1 DNA (cytosine-5-)-methyltransferase [Bacteroidales bacterium]MCF8312146.1 DNA (cytosine-5-)-methyltransferase [Saprospiraceae bacterium]MCF8442198.1 DNA (cytosine-5-)-methyltransferase [Saprospiraceae bacterium]